MRSIQIEPPMTRFCLHIAATALVVASGVWPAAAQPTQAWPVQVRQGRTLIETYRAARLQRLADAYLARYGGPLAPMPAEELQAATPEVQAWLARIRPPVLEPVLEDAGPRITVEDWQLMKRLERPYFDARFGDVEWAYLGSNYRTPIDTIRTQELRARLQATFGDPTQTLAELDAEEFAALREFIQFEYWFVLNDSIPLKVMDVNGPLERGVVVATDHRYREILFDLRAAFLQRVALSTELAPYVDYYYNPAVGAWYRSGYEDGRFFLDMIPRPKLWRGRPRLDSAGG